MNKRIGYLLATIFGLTAVTVGSLFGMMWFAIGWIMIFLVCNLSDLYYCKKHNKNYYLEFSPFGVAGGMIATMIHAIIVGMNE